MEIVLSLCIGVFHLFAQLALGMVSNTSSDVSSRFVRSPLILRDLPASQLNGTLRSGDEFVLTVWDVYKFTSDLAYGHLAKISERSDMVLVQEMTSGAEVLNSFEKVSSAISLVMAPAFEMSTEDGNGAPKFAGVGLISKFLLSSQQVLLSPDPEPFA